MEIEELKSLYDKLLKDEDPDNPPLDWWKGKLVFKKYKPNKNILVNCRYGRKRKKAK